MKQPLKPLFLLVALSLLSGCEYIDDMPLVARYIAKNVCSGAFVEGFQEQVLVDTFVTPIIPEVKNTWDVNVDYENEALYAQVPETSLAKQLDSTIPWPYGAGGAQSTPMAGVDYDKIQAVYDHEFSDVDGKNTVAMLLVYDGQLIAERYHQDINANSPLKGFSMSKSLINGLVGTLVNDGDLSVAETTGLDAWQNDDRKNITVEQLIHMESGLRFTEHAIGDTNDQGKLFYGAISPTQYALNLQQETVPGTQFNYSSGDNLIAAKVVQDTLGGSIQNAYDLYKTEFFDRIDAVIALVEHDVEGTFLSPESLFLSTRDWARFAQLYMNKGNWNGEQVLSEEWVNYSLTPGQHSNQYGANIWVNHSHEAFPSLPEDTFAFYGALERFVIAVPSRKAIIVRIVYTHNRETVNVDEIASELLTALALVQ